MVQFGKDPYQGIASAMSTKGDNSERLYSLLKSGIAV